MLFRPRPRVSAPRRMTRTQVTVEEYQRTVLLNMSSMAGICLCPLCGQPVTPLSNDMEGPVTLEPSQVHVRCPGPEDIVVEQDPRLDRSRNTRRLR
jgi:hypothetical protein